MSCALHLHRQAGKHHAALYLPLTPVFSFQIVFPCCASEISCYLKINKLLLNTQLKGPIKSFNRWEMLLNNFSFPLCYLSLPLFQGVSMQVQCFSLSPSPFSKPNIQHCIICERFGYVAATWKQQQFNQFLQGSGKSSCKDLWTLNGIL